MERFIRTQSNKNKMKDFFPEKIGLYFSEKKDGPMNFVGHEAFDSERRANRSSYLKSIGLSAYNIVSPKVFHGAHVESVGAYNPIYGTVLADAIITDKKGLGLTMNFADCPPVVFYDPINEVIALAHCGWKPLAGKIVKKTLEKLRIEHNCFTSNIHIVIGPGICQDHYEVGPEVAMMFGVDTHGEKTYLSLENEVLNQCLSEGVRLSNIKIDGSCTLHTENDFSKNKYFSWRRDRSNPLETNMAVLVIK